MQRNLRQLKQPRTHTLARAQAVYRVSKGGEERVSEVINPEANDAVNRNSPSSHVADTATWYLTRNETQSVYREMENVSIT